MPKDAFHSDYVKNKLEKIAKKKPKWLNAGPDPREQEIISKAEKYVIYVRMGIYDSFTEEFKSFKEAEKRAKELAAMKNRSVLIYAVWGKSHAYMATQKP